MLETSTEHVLCGGILEAGSFAELYCNPTTGDVAYESPSDETPMLVGEISVDNPLPSEDIAPIRKDLVDGRYPGVIGIILRTDSVIVILEDEMAEVREFDKIGISNGAPFRIDLDQEYEYADQ